MTKQGIRTALAAIAMLLAGCQTTEGEQAVDWTYFPGDREPGTLSITDRTLTFEEDLRAAKRLPHAVTLACGPFQIEVRANPESLGTKNNIIEAARTGDIFNGFFMLIKAPDGFRDRVIFRELFYPDFNARTFVNIDGEWIDITSPGYTSEPPATTDTFAERFLGFEPDRHRDAFFDSIYIAHVPWNEFVLRSTYRQGAEAYPEGRYRISFTTPYEMEWPTGSCQFRLPDLEFTFQKR